MVDTEDKDYELNPIILDKFVSFDGNVYCEIDERVRKRDQYLQQLFTTDLSEFV